MDQTKKPEGKIKFYADSPDGKTINKYFCYAVYDLDHGVDIAGKFLNKDWRIRACYYQYPDGNSIKVLQELIEQAKTQPFYHLRRANDNKMKGL